MLFEEHFGYIFFIFSDIRVDITDTNRIYENEVLYIDIMIQRDQMRMRAQCPM